MKKMNKKGFTLIEMLVVIAIIAILVSIIIPVVSNSTAKAQAATNAANLRSVKAEIVTDMLSTGKTAQEAADAADSKWGATGNAGVKFYKCDTAGGFDAEAQTNGDVKVTWGGKSVQEWAADAGQAS